MVAFRFDPVAPHPLLRPYIARMYVFESSGRLPVDDTKLIVPNATFKLTLTFRNGISARIGEKTFIQNENKLSLTGLIDSPVTLDPTEDTQTGTIIIEFKPEGIYRFFRLPYTEARNQIIELPELIGNRANKLQAQLADANTNGQRLQLLQDFLLKQLEQTSDDSIYTYCIDRISGSKGLVSVAQLEKETGYSSRWLHKKFMEHLGSGPKTLAEIVRFKQFYQAYATQATPHVLRGFVYEYYHDQSHFIRAFKRFTGFTPTVLQQSMNELATKHYTS